jgi:transketolase
LLSKGHAATALYAALSWKGVIKRCDLKKFGQKGSLLEEHPTPKQPGVEAATGSLGHGLSIGNGMALSTRITDNDFHVFVLMSDGECNEGSVWEAAMFASQHKLLNLTAIVDFNKWQATGRSQNVLKLEPLADKWTSFGWEVSEVDGHDHQILFNEFSKNSINGPKMVICHTVKGKGISFMEDDNNWHYRVPTGEEVRKAKVELGVV